MGENYGVYWYIEPQTTVCVCVCVCACVYVCVYTHEQYTGRLFIRGYKWTQMGSIVVRVFLSLIKIIWGRTRPTIQPMQRSGARDDECHLNSLEFWNLYRYGLFGQFKVMHEPCHENLYNLDMCSPKDGQKKPLKICHIK